MADVNRGNRPLSPFMLGSAYRFQWTSAISILTRITGNALIVGAALVAWWLIAAATGPGAFARADGVLRSWFGDLVLLGSVWALWFHSLTGIRHLIWDQRKMMEIRLVERSGMVIVALSVLLTILTVVIL
jgi:succinate dehydrogenase / fumarate reductase, cytochrome b subunit